MALPPYVALEHQLRNKNRGRKHEANVNKAPELWAKLDTYSGNIYVTGYGKRVATLRPDNTLTIDIGGWHTQASVKIIEALSGRGACLCKNRIWTCGSPVQNGRLDYDAARHYLTPEGCLKLRDDVANRLDRVTLNNLPDKDRLRLEIGSWHPSPAVTQKVLAYALGKAGSETLGARDVWTCIHDKEGITTRCLEKELT